MVVIASAWARASPGIRQAALAAFRLLQSTTIIPTDFPPREPDLSEGRGPTRVH
jgi:hypothetical protein